MKFRENTQFENNIAVLDIGKTHAKVILFDAIELEELAVFQSNNKISLLTKENYPSSILVTLLSLLLWRNEDTSVTFYEDKQKKDKTHSVVARGHHNSKGKTQLRIYLGLQSTNRL